MNVNIEYSTIGSFPTYFEDINNPTNVSIAYTTEKCFITYNNSNYLVSMNDVNDLLKTLSSIRIFELPDIGIGLDGVIYKIKISNGFNSLEFEWWEDTCGEQWKGLFEFRDKIILLLKKSLKKN